ncbi:SpaA isopeptide-forming pilin-related protein (plasmid) [Streptomyces sp. NBC_01298]|uniref:MSCRAMM family protein n=1 Tax=Streptomyces sp. NBC_01298 TaxID=2903817 RepID=UPI002E1047D3|nr:SpaA isopeptide-forming pilin-related protein [Streptomyces sp. NBC_01298]WSK25931.1 SpaA isopeptide-forming pilin-related protein [Streptomyces sp. NBC_01298]
MHAPLARATTRLTAITIAAAAAGTLSWSAAAAPAQSDKYGPGYAIPDSDGNAATSHIGAYGPPGMTVYGQWETYCADPERKGPDAAGGYSGPATVEHWTSSVTGKQVPDAHLAYASYIVGKYGQTQNAAQAAAVDAVVYEWLAGGAYGIDGARGKQRLGYPNVSSTARTLAADYLEEAKKYAGPYRLTLTPKVTETPAGKKVAVTATVTATLSGTKVPGVKVRLTESGTDGEKGQVTTGQDGTATWEFTADAKGTTTVGAEADGLPGSQLKVLAPRDDTAQRMLLAGDTTTAKDQTAIKVTAAPGGVTIRKKDPGGEALAGTSFQLLDPATGKTVAEGKTGADGVLVFDNLAPGTYRLRETDSGSPLHATVPDQDITITEGKTAAANPITIVDPFKQGELLVKKIDKATGKPLAGAVIAINADTVDASGKHTKGKELTQLTTGKDGTAKLKLDVTLKNGTTYWATEAKPPAGYEADAAAQQFTAKPGAQVTVTLADTKSPTPISPPPTTPPPAAKPPAAQPPAPSGQLAHTGASSTTWLIAAGGVLLAAGGTAVWAGNRRRLARTHSG